MLSYPPEDLAGSSAQSQLPISQGRLRERDTCDEPREGAEASPGGAGGGAHDTFRPATLDRAHSPLPPFAPGKGAQMRLFSKTPKRPWTGSTVFQSQARWQVGRRGDSGPGSSAPLPQPGASLTCCSCRRKR